MHANRPVFARASLGTVPIFAWDAKAEMMAREDSGVVFAWVVSWDCWRWRAWSRRLWRSVCSRSTMNETERFVEGEALVVGSFELFMVGALHPREPKLLQFFDGGVG